MNTVTLAAATIATLVNAAVAGWQYRRRHEYPIGEPWALMYAFTAVFACFYTAMFAVLIWGNPDRAEWSEALTPFSAFSFVTVWTGPAILGAVKLATIGRLHRRAEQIRADE